MLPPMLKPLTAALMPMPMLTSLTDSSGNALAEASAISLMVAVLHADAIAVAIVD